MDIIERITHMEALFDRAQKTRKKSHSYYTHQRKDQQRRNKKDDTQRVGSFAGLSRQL